MSKGPETVASVQRNVRGRCGRHLRTSVDRCTARRVELRWTGQSAAGKAPPYRAPVNRAPALPDPATATAARRGRDRAPGGRATTVPLPKEPNPVDDLFGAVRRGPPPGSMLARLLDGPLAEGCVTWIGLRPARREPVRAVAEAVAEAGRGLRWDRYARTDGGRQVTLIAEESLRAIGSFLGGPSAAPERLRRNLVVRGINLLALKDRRFRVGDALFECSGECHPCSRMNEELGPLGYNAVRGHGGITARVLEGGVIRIGDGVSRVPDPS